MNNNSNNNNNNNKAFSLIELSIVLIIIGLLIAGITGGQSLIGSAKIQSLIKEITEYKQVSYLFQIQKGRLPGDLNNDGKIGYNSGEAYDDNSFGGNYVSSNINYGLPSDRVGFFVELYINKMISFEPKKHTPSTARLEWDNGGSPKSKISEDSSYQFQWAQSCGYDKTFFKNDFCCNGGCNDFIVHNKTDSAKHLISPDLAGKLDKKLDDGIYNQGKIRGSCYERNKNKGERGYSSYENSKLNGGRCYSLDINFDKIF